MLTDSRASARLTAALWIRRLRCFNPCRIVELRSPPGLAGGR